MSGNAPAFPGPLKFSTDLPIPPPAALHERLFCFRAASPCVTV